MSELPGNIYNLNVGIKLMIVITLIWPHTRIGGGPFRVSTFRHSNNLFNDEMSETIHVF